MFKRFGGKQIDLLLISSSSFRTNNYTHKINFLFVSFLPRFIFIHWRKKLTLIHHSFRLENA
jgi:hypothetical protein